MAQFYASIGPEGPILHVLVGVSAPKAAALVAASSVVPPPQVVRLLIDTGASHTSICESAISKLGLTPTGTMSMMTPSTGTTPVAVPIYDVSLAIAGHAGAVHNVPVMPIMACDFSGQSIDGLFGRDLLANALFSYAGAGQMFALAF